MLRVLLVILAFAAIASWAVAVWAAAAVFRLAPPGRKMQVYFDLGWWRFDKVRSVAGPASEPYIRSFRTAFLAFFAVVVSVILFTVLMAWPS